MRISKRRRKERTHDEDRNSSLHNRGEVAADFRGRRASGRFIKVNRKRRYVPDVREPGQDSTETKPTRSELARLRRMRAKRLAQLRNSGQFNDKAMRLIAGIMYGLGLSDVARLENERRQATEQRLQKLAGGPADFIYKYWRRKNIMRRRK